jgi:lysophospholipid acyltransferase (LPLAT)-like uncharacterized protein
MAKKSLYKRIRKRLRQSWIAAFISSILAWGIMHALFLTCRKQVFGDDVFYELAHENHGKLLGASWHRSIFYIIYYFRKREAAIMSSRSSDGQFITEILKRFGFNAFRGSSGQDKGGAIALKQFVDYINRGHFGGLAVDAPKGPPYISKIGIIAAALHTGAPLLPVVWYAKPNYRIKSWDRSIVPKPFSELVMIFDREAMRIPADLSKKEIEAYRDKLDNRLLRLTYQADHWFDLRDRYDDPRDIPVPDPVPLPHHPA